MMEKERIGVFGIERINIKIVKRSRKERTCIRCGKKIDVGSSLYEWVGKILLKVLDEGDKTVSTFQRRYMHFTCMQDANAKYYWEHSDEFHRLMRKEFPESFLCFITERM